MTSVRETKAPPLRALSHLDLMAQRENLEVQGRVNGRHRGASSGETPVVSNSTFDRGSLSPTYFKPFDVFANGGKTGDWLLRLDSNQQPSG